MSDINEISLLDEITKNQNRYDVSIITTFTADLNFYEEIVWHKLKVAGCRANALLIDSDKFQAICNQNQSYRFGTEYTLLPIEVSNGVFHPKIVLLIGKNHCALFVGSHNQTHSAHTHNRELTAFFEIDRESAIRDKQIYCDVWQTLQNWTKDLPGEMLSIFDYAQQIGGWALKNEEEISLKTFFATDETSLSLWNQIKPYLPENIQQAILISPFFDENLTFLRHIEKELNPQEFIVGIEPKTVHISPNAFEKMPNVEFVETDILQSGDGYLHAKSLYLKDKTGKEFFILGSANASYPAWLADGSGRNFESVILLNSFNDGLGIKALTQSPIISAETWRLINPKRNEPEKDSKKSTHILFAVETKEGFQISFGRKFIEFEKDVELITKENEKVYLEQKTDFENKFVLIQIEENLRQKIKRINLTSINGESFTAFIHETSVINENLSQSHYRKIFQTMIENDSFIDHEIFKVIERIWQEGEEIPEYLSASIGFSERPQNFEIKSFNNAPQEVFSIEATDDSTYSNSRVFAKDGIGELLSSVNKTLFIPSDKKTSFSSEEDLIGSDDDKNSDQKQMEQAETLANLCRAKTKTMMSRMINKMKKANVEDVGKSVSIVRQISAVLACLYLVRKDEAKVKENQLNQHLEFIESAKEWNFFLDATHFLYSEEYKILENAGTYSARLNKEISEMFAYLIWLAKDVGFDIERLERFHKAPYGTTEIDNWTLEEIIHGTGRMLKLAKEFCQNETTRNFAERLLSSDKHTDWFEQHSSWMKDIYNICNNLQDFTIANQIPNIGDFVYLNRSRAKEIYIVLKNPSSIFIIDLTAKDEYRNKHKDYVSVVK